MQGYNEGELIHITIYPPENSTLGENEIHGILGWFSVSKMCTSGKWPEALRAQALFSIPGILRNLKKLQAGGYFADIPFLTF